MSKSSERGAIDFEAYEWTNPFLAAIVSPTHSELLVDSKFTTPDRFAEFVLKQLLARTKQGLAKEWWAHNAGKYDGLLLSAAARRLGWNQTGAIAGGSRVITWRYSPRSESVSVVLNDSFAVIPSKLEDVAKDFELPSRKLFKKDDYSHFDTRDRAFAYWQRESKRIKEGCLIDAKLVLEALDKVETLIEDWGGSLKHTFSSSALSIILEALCVSGLEWPNITPSVNSYCRLGYYGARVEVYRHSPGRISEYDINSSYPYAMTHEVPWNYAGTVAGQDARDAYNKGYAGIYEATVDVPEWLNLPPLPYVGPDGSLYFPVGRWTAQFPGNELAYAASLGCRVQIHSGAIFSKGTPFTEFINKVYALKQTSTGAVRNFTKLLLNGSYGKAGEKPEKEQLRIFADATEAIHYAFENEGNVTQLGEDPRVCSVAVFRWPPTTHYALASYITAYARIHLHKLLCESQKPAYCDSDSIHCEVNGMPQKHISTELGGLKEEIHEGEAKYYAPKIYEIRDALARQCEISKQCVQCTKGPTKHLHFACKGFPVEEEAFRKMVSGMQVSRDRMVLAKTQFRSGGQHVSRKTDTKAWHGYSSKRKAINSAETVPWTVDEINNKEHLEMKSPLYKGKK